MWQELTDLIVNTSLLCVLVLISGNVDLGLLFHVSVSISCPGPSLHVSGFLQTISLCVDCGALILTGGLCHFFLFFWALAWFFLGFWKTNFLRHAGRNSHMETPILRIASLCPVWSFFCPLSYSGLFSENTDLMRSPPGWNVFGASSLLLS